eukprot:403366196
MIFARLTKFKNIKLLQLLFHVLLVLIMIFGEIFCQKTGGGYFQYSYNRYSGGSSDYKSTYQTGFNYQYGTYFYKKTSYGGIWWIPLVVVTFVVLAFIGLIVGLVVRLNIRFKTALCIIFCCKCATYREYDLQLKDQYEKELKQWQQATSERQQQKKEQKLKIQQEIESVLGREGVLQNQNHGTTKIQGLDPESTQQAFYKDLQSKTQSKFKGNESQQHQLKSNTNQFIKTNNNLLGQHVEFHPSHKITSSPKTSQNNQLKIHGELPPIKRGRFQNLNQQENIKNQQDQIYDKKSKNLLQTSSVKNLNNIQKQRPEILEQVESERNFQHIGEPKQNKGSLMSNFQEKLQIFSDKQQNQYD